MQALAGRLRKGVGIALAVGALAPATASADQLLTADEAIIQNSTCIGTQCTTDESFGFDTLRLREDNLRLDFMDTSNPAGDRASTDWRLVANESEANGDDVFEIQDAGDDGGLQDSVFRLFAGAPANAMVLDPEGDLGLGTDEPGLDLHLTETDTPGIRLEQTASPFAAQTWDVAGNEANFFVRDLTGGSSLPFRIRPGAPTSSIDIGGDGDVGIGDSSPEARLDVNGDVRTEGAIAQLSDADAKNSVTPVDPADILRKVNALPISTWKYDDDASGRTHLGPMAQDFYARFGVGVERYVSLQDLAGVSLAANQALSQQADGLDNRVGALGSRVGDLDSRVGALEGAGPGAPDLTPRVDELESSLAKANKQIKKLNKRVKKLAKR